MINGVLYQFRRSGTEDIHAVFVPKTLRNSIISELNDTTLGAHNGAEKIHKQMIDKCWWPGMTKSIRKYVQECVACPLRKTTNHPSIGELRTWSDALPRDSWAINFIGPLPRTLNGNVYLCVAVDMGSRWVVSKPMPQMDTESTANFLFEEIICKYGMFKNLISDRGSNFMSEIFQELLKILKIKHLPTVAWKPSTNSMVERCNREFGR